MKTGIIVLKLWETDKTLMSFGIEGKRFRSGMEKNLEAHNRGNLNFVVTTNAGYPGPWRGLGQHLTLKWPGPDTARV